MFVARMTAFAVLARDAAISVARFEEAERKVIHSGIGNIAGVLASLNGDLRRMVSMAGTAGYNARNIRAFDSIFLEASDGDQGRRIARSEQPDVIILDLRIPTVDRFTVLQELNVDSRTSVIPVIVSTSLNVNAELKPRIPAGTRVISQNTISRANVSLVLRDATQGVQ